MIKLLLFHTNVMMSLLYFQASEALARLEIDLELQDKITKAALKLAQDKSVAKSVRKQRKQQYHKSHQKVIDGDAGMRTG